MTGSLQIKYNSYYVVLSYKDEHNNRKQKWIKTGIPAVPGNVRRARAYLRETLRQYETQPLSDLLFCDYLETWLEEQKPLLSPTTYQGYCSNITRHIIPYFRDKKLKLVELKAHHLEEYYRTKLLPGGRLDGKGGLNPVSIKHHHQNIAKALHDAVRRELILSNPADLAQTPKAQKYSGTFLNLAQLQDLVLLFENTPFALPVKLLATYGMRRSEVLGLCWDCVDFNNHQFTIRRTFLQHNGGDILQDSTKNDSSYRTLPMTAQIYALLQKQQAAQAEYRRLMGNCYRDSSFVCTLPDGTPIRPNYLSRTFGNTIRKSNLPAIRIHDLRHSAASNLLAMGFSVVEVQHWLGHSQPSTTLNFYSHIDSTAKRHMGAALEQALQFGI